MYDELVKRLREVADEVDNDYNVDPYDAEQRSFVIEKSADAIEQLSNAGSAYGRGWTLGYDAGREESKPRWIPVTERLPEEEETVLVVRKFMGIKECPACTYVETAERIGDRWVSDSDEYKIARSKHTDPTHWMPLPEPPREEREDADS